MCLLDRRGDHGHIQGQDEVHQHGDIRAQHTGAYRQHAAGRPSLETSYKSFDELPATFPNSLSGGGQYWLHFRLPQD